MFAGLRLLTCVSPSWLSGDWESAFPGGRGECRLLMLRGGWTRHRTSRQLRATCADAVALVCARVSAMDPSPLAPAVKYLYGCPRWQSCSFLLRGTQRTVCVLNADGSGEGVGDPPARGCLRVGSRTRRGEERVRSSQGLRRGHLRAGGFDKACERGL